MLVRLMYASRPTPALGAEALSAVVRRSKAHNPSVGVTGVLCASDGFIVQLLEGGRGPVNALYNRIAADPRHTQVELLAYDEIAERRFAGWAMGHVDVARLNPALLLKYCEQATLDPYAVSGRAALALFDELVTTAAIVCS